MIDATILNTLTSLFNLVSLLHATFYKRISRGFFSYNHLFLLTL